MGTVKKSISHSTNGTYRCSGIIDSGPLATGWIRIKHLLSDNKSIIFRPMSRYSQTLSVVAQVRSIGIPQGILHSSQHSPNRYTEALRFKKRGNSGTEIPNECLSVTCRGSYPSDSATAFFSQIRKILYETQILQVANDSLSTCCDEYRCLPGQS